MNDKIIGCILGLALGDALGAPLEGAKPGAVKANFRTVTDYVDAEELLGPKLRRWRTPGLYTDDTQQAMAFLDAALERRGFDAARAAELLVKLSRGDSVFQYGVLRGAPPDLRTAIDNLKPGTKPPGAAVPYEGNSPAVRVAPVVVYHAEQPHTLPDKVIESCLVTHKSPVSVGAAAAVASLVAQMLARDEYSPGDAPEFLARATEFAKLVETRLGDRYQAAIDWPEASGRLHLFSGALEALASRLGDHPDKVGEWIAENANPHAPYEIKRPTMDFALASVVHAIYVFLKNGENFEKALVAAVNQGGDADSIGAIVGAVAGALHGAAAIPERWLKGLANRKQLKTRAEALAEKKYKPGLIQDLYEMEYSLTRKEHEEREARIRKSRRAAHPQEREKQQKPDTRPTEKFDRKKYEKQIKKQKRDSREKFFQQ